MVKVKGSYHSRHAGPELEEYLPLLGLLVEDVQARPALERAEAAKVGEGREVEVLGLGHREAPDEEVEEARVVHVYGGLGGCRVNACRGCRQGGVAPPLRPGGTVPARPPPRHPAPHRTSRARIASPTSGPGGAGGRRGAQGAAGKRVVFPLNAVCYCYVNMRLIYEFIRIEWP